MARKRGPIHALPVGATSLLTVFAVLCLTVFSLLTLSDVRADARLADAALENVRAYYAADVRAQELLAQLRHGQRPEGVSVSGSGPFYADYTVPITDAQELRVSVRWDDREYRILRWQSAPTQPWQGDDNTQLWIPE